MTNETLEKATVVDSAIQRILEKILFDQGISNYKITNQAGSNNGDNYLGIIIRTKVDGIDKKGNDVTKNFILKCAQTSDGYRKFDILEQGYSRESYVYAKLHPLFRKFQLERQILNPFTSYPICYAHTNEKLHEALIMEDMAVRGYRMQSRLKTLNVHHCKLVLRELGKWHALSFSFRDQEPDLYADKRSQNLGAFPEKALVENNMKNRIRDVLSSFDPVKEKDQLEKYIEVTASLLDDMYELTSPEAADGYEVILHGDCWINNMLFKYENTDDLEHPSEICFLDWQLSRLGCPLVDIFYFIYICTDKELRDQYFEELMYEYYSSLASFMDELGSSAQKLYPQCRFRKDMKKFGRWGLAVCFLLVPLITEKGEDLPNFADETAMGRDVSEVMEGVTTSDYSKRRIKDCFLHMYDNDFL